MKRVQLELSHAAANDILEQARWYEQQSGARLAARWENAVTSALFRVLRQPYSGSLCSFKTSQLSGTRRVSITKFPKHLIFYRINGDLIVVLRIIHGARDLENLL